MTYYFTMKSSSNSPGGKDDHYEVLQSPLPNDGRRWSMDTKMNALCKDKGLTEHIAKLLQRYPYEPKK
jgi:hypothetical protein